LRRGGNGRRFFLPPAKIQNMQCSVMLYGGSIRNDLQTICNSLDFGNRQCDFESQ